MDYRAMRHTADIFPDRQLLVPARARISSWERPRHPAGCVFQAMRRPRPARIRNFLRAAPDVTSFAPPFLDAIVRYSMRPCEQYDFARSI